MTFDPIRKVLLEEASPRSVLRNKVTARKRSELEMLSTTPSGRSGIGQRISRH
jgi:hypothetical protein